MNDASSDAALAVVVTEDWIDPVFDQPYIEIDELRSEPVPHRYVHGGFTGTAARFSFYFPSKEQYQGRFFHNTYPLAMTADIGPFPIAFAVATGDLPFTLDSGAYYVQTNNGGAFSRHSTDPSIAAYRVNAAAAKYSRIVAAENFGDHRPYGYLYGGSGGAYQVLGGAEHTQGIWDGFMPFVLGCNNATPSNWTPRMLALHVLRRRDKFPAIMDAINPGGSGDMYADLDAEERAALEEATRMGFPPSGWYAHETQGSGYFADMQGVIPTFDPTYVDDFWTKPGYIGGDPTASIHADRFRFETTVSQVIDDLPLRFELESVSGRSIGDAHLVLLDGPNAGQSVAIARVDGLTITPANTSDAAVVAAIQPGSRVAIDNAWPLALQTYHRHQVPPDPAEYGWNQFRDAAGEPIYPQRPLLMGHVFAKAAIGSVLSGNVHGKTLLIQSLMDIDALAWFADWYRSRVKAELPSRFDDDFALWFVDHTQHDNPASAIARAHTVPLTGALQHGLRDLARWVEQGVKPSETRYRVADGQVEVPDTAGERLGVQPVVHLAVNGSQRAEIGSGEAVSFSGTADVLGSGKIVAAEWDFEGTGDFSSTPEIGEPAGHIEVDAVHTYAARGTYFAALRVTSQREGHAGSPHCRLQNLARVRVVVT